MFGRHPTRWLAPYAEGLLPSAQASQIAGHVLCCPRCRRALDLVRTGQALAAALSPAPDEAPSWSELAPLLDAPARPVPAFRWAFAAAVAALVAAGGLAWRGFRSVEARASAPLEDLALDAHRDGTCELRTADAHLAESWLVERAGLEVSAPLSGGERHLQGAARLAGGAVALAYRLGEEPVTLVVAAAAATADRKRISRRTEGALEVASWSRGNRTYALVSRLRAGVACTLCHSAVGPAALL
jgi:uncharacterized protein YbaR (Trm112 family)